MSGYQTTYKHVFNTMDGLIDSIYLSESTVSNGSTLYNTNPNKIKNIQNNDYKSSLDIIIFIEMGLMALYFGISHYLESKNSFDNQQNNKLKVFKAENRQKFRYCLSEFKNAHHMVMNIGLLAHMSLQMYLILSPIGFALGAVGAVGRLKHEAMKNERKDWIKKNNEALAAIAAGDAKKEFTPYKESKLRNGCGLALAGALSFVDGNYLFGCWLLFFGMTIGALTGWGLIVAAAGFAAYTLASVVVRVNEELKAQRELELSAVEVEIALLEKSMQEDNLKMGTNAKLQALKQKRDNLKQAIAPQKSCTVWLSARGMISGLKNGLAAVHLLIYTVARHIVKGLAVLIASLAAAVIYGVGLTIKAYKKNQESKTKSALVFSDTRSECSTPVSYAEQPRIAT